MHRVALIVPQIVQDVPTIVPVEVVLTALVRTAVGVKAHARDATDAIAVQLVVAVAIKFATKPYEFQAPERYMTTLTRSALWGIAIASAMLLLSAWSLRESLCRFIPFEIPSCVNSQAWKDAMKAGMYGDFSQINDADYGTGTRSASLESIAKEIKDLWSVQDGSGNKEAIHKALEDYSRSESDPVLQAYALARVVSYFPRGDTVLFEEIFSGDELSAFNINSNVHESLMTLANYSLSLHRTSAMVRYVSFADANAILTRSIQKKPIPEEERERLERSVAEAEALQESENVVAGVPFYPVARQRFSHDMAFLYGALAFASPDIEKQEKYTRLFAEHTANVVGTYDRSINSQGQRSPLLASLVPYTFFHRAIFASLSTTQKSRFVTSIDGMLKALTQDTQIHDRYFNAYMRNLPMSSYVFDIYAVEELKKAAAGNAALKEYLIKQGWVFEE